MKYILSILAFIIIWIAGIAISIVMKVKGVIVYAIIFGVAYYISRLIYTYFKEKETSKNKDNSQ